MTEDALTLALYDEALLCFVVLSYLQVPITLTECLSERLHLQPEIGDSAFNLLLQWDSLIVTKVLQRRCHNCEIMRDNEVHRVHFVAPEPVLGLKQNPFMHKHHIDRFEDVSRDNPAAKV